MAQRVLCVLVRSHYYFHALELHILDPNRGASIKSAAVPLFLAGGRDESQEARAPARSQKHLILRAICDGLTLVIKENNAFNRIDMSCF